MTIHDEDRAITILIGEHGLLVSSVWDLVHMKSKYPEAIPVLVDALPRVHDLGVLEGLVRALTVREGIPTAALPLIAAFRRLLGDMTPRAASVRWAIANALTVVATPEVADDLLELLSRLDSGNARKMLALAIATLGDKRAVPLLMQLLDDEDIVGHAAVALGTLRATEARSHLERLVTHRKAWIRKEADRALLKLDGKPEAKRCKHPIN